ncbi:MAG: hypothetical protein KGJ59_07405 [Bacteroidota bacterium]|nr:hypothetical protein [Bacteroidota bacterium]
MKARRLTYRRSKALVLRTLAAALAMLFGLSSLVFAQLDILSPANGTITTLHSQTVTVKTMSGFDAQLWVNGKLAMKSKVVRPDGIIDFINVQVPSGNDTLEVRLVNPDGSEIFSDVRAIHVLGPPAAFTFDLDNDRLPADGKTTAQGVVHVLDEWGVEYKNNLVLTVVADSGEILSQDIDSSKLGVQVPLVNGAAHVEYRTGTSAGTANITVQIGDLKMSKQMKLETPTEPFTLVGLVSGMGTAATSGGVTDQIADATAYKNGFDGEGRVAVYARGSVYKNYLLTASLDTDRKNRSQFFRQLDPDYLYSIYGDNSMLYYDAQTNRNFFAKIERDQSYLYYGDYNTDMSQEEFAMYNRTLNGIKFSDQQKQWNVTGFGSLTDRRAVQKIIRGEGLSGYYDLGYTHITTGSEKIRIETRDRFHSEVVLKIVDESRFSDYQIDYEQGTVFFKQPVPAIDGEGNPVYIVATFEAVTGAASSYVAGGRVENSFLPNTTIGLMAVTEQQSPTNYLLFGSDVKYQLGELFGVKGEIAHSSSIFTSGTAYKVESSIAPLSGVALKGYYRKVGSGFSNTTESNGTAELGTEKYGVSGTLQPFASTRVNGEYYQQHQTLQTGSTSINSLTGGVDQEITSQLHGQVDLSDVDYHQTAQDTLGLSQKTHSILGSAKLTYALDQRLTLAAIHERNLGTNQDPTRPNGTSLEGNYKLTKDVSVSGQEKFYDGGGNLSSIGLSSNVFQGTSAYGKYEIGNAAGQYRNMLSVGLKNILHLPYDLTANFAYERAKSLERRFNETTTPDHSAYSAGLEYLPKEEPVKASTKVEYGDYTSNKKMNFTFAGDYRFQRDLSAIVKYELSDDDAKKSSGFETRSHLIAGLAYRPVDFNWLNILGKYEVKHDNNHYLSPFDDYTASIASVHAYVEPVQRLEIGLKYAFKIADEASVDFSATTHTNFYLVRAQYALIDKFDIAAEYRALTQREVNDMLNGYSAEVGYIALKNTRVAVGYNFKGYKERDLVDYSLWTRGPFVHVEFKFDEGLLGLQ